MLNVRLIAFYLPQFHPIPENDLWWGKGFTEWTNVGKAKSFFKGHYQPRIPADLGYYDLRLPEIRKQQADIARKFGIEGFCYWHYWFGNGKKLLDLPIKEMLKSKEPNFPFCLGWANESWKGFSHGINNREVLIEQLYPGVEDYKNHFYDTLDAFKDPRYLKIGKKPIFLIYKPLESSQVKIFIQTWRQLAVENGLDGIYFIGHHTNVNVCINEVLEVGVDAVNTVRLLDKIILDNNFISKIYNKFKKIILGLPRVYSYSKISKYFISKEVDNLENVYPSIIPGWDHSPRSGKEGLILHRSTPELFGKHVKDALKVIKHKKQENKIIFIKSWNEWAEGNYLEPDLKWGYKYLETLKNQIEEN
jgi:hypothetical protein